MIGEEERQADARFQEALKIKSELRDVPLSSLTFGELSFLLSLFGFKHSRKVHPDQLERLREIAQKAGAV